MLLAAGREVVSKTSAYNITKLSYRDATILFLMWSLEEINKPLTKT